MPGEISRSYDGPKDGSPLIPEWICPRCNNDKSKCKCLALESMPESQPTRKPKALSTYNDFQAWWICYERDVSHSAMLSTKSIAFDAWLAAIELLEVKGDNTQKDAVCPKSAVLRCNDTLVCIEDGEPCTGANGDCQDNERIYS